MTHVQEVESAGNVVLVVLKRELVRFSHRFPGLCSELRVSQRCHAAETLTHGKVDHSPDLALVLVSGKDLVDR
jgi:hypothetical protein